MHAATAATSTVHRQTCRSDVCVGRGVHHPLPVYVIRCKSPLHGDLSSATVAQPQRVSVVFSSQIQWPLWLAKRQQLRAQCRRAPVQSTWLLLCMLVGHAVSTCRCVAATGLESSLERSQQALSTLTPGLAEYDTGVTPQGHLCRTLEADRFHLVPSLCDSTLGQLAEHSASACAADLPVPICEHMAGQLTAHAAAAGVSEIQTGTSPSWGHHQG